MGSPAPGHYDVLRDPDRLAALRRLRDVEPIAEEAFARLARLAARLVRAPMAIVTLVDDTKQFVKSSYGLPEPWASAADLPVDWGFCVATMAGGKPKLIAAVLDDPDFASDPAVEALGAVSVACVPLVDDDERAIGVLSVIDVEPRRWDDEDRELIAFLARSIMNELQLRANLSENQRLLELSAGAAQREALRARQLRGLAETSMMMTTTLSLDERLEIVAERARDLIGAHLLAIRMKVNGGWGEAITCVSLSDQYAEWRKYQAPLTGEGIYAMVAETNRPLRLTQEGLEAQPRWRRFSGEAERHPPLRGLLAAPLVGAEGDNMGVILLSDKYDGEFTPEDEAILVQLSRHTSRAAENSQQYEREHEIAATLQKSFLPNELPEVPGLDLAAAYLPGTQGLAVGGDWYDAVTVGDTSVALVVGDVVGHGVRAAAIMGQLRNALRAYLHEGFRVSGVLERLDRLADSVGAGDFATVAVVELEPATGWTRWSTAGQLPPLVVNADGTSSFLEGPVAPPLGAGLPSVFVESTARIPPGSTLVLYTDGLVESRTQPLDEGMEGLRAAVVDALAGGCEDAAGVVHFLVQRLTGSVRDDDVALLVACMTSQSAGGP